MDVVVHDDEAVEFHALAKAEAIEAVEDDAFDHVSLEEVQVVHRFGGDKVEMVGVEVGFPGGHVGFPSFGFGNPKEHKIWQSKKALLLC